MIIHDCIQLSPAWWEARRGIPTSSEFSRIITPVKGEPSKSWDDYIDELVAEVVSLDPPVMTEQYGNPAMRHGLDTEAEARSWYALEHEYEARRVGFVTTDDGRFGCSPDGLVYSEAGELPAGGLELKCPQPKTHVRYLREKVLPADYRPQVHGQLVVTGLPWIDFVSYARGFPPLYVRVTPDSFTERLRLYLDDFHKKYRTALGLIRDAG